MRVGKRGETIFGQNRTLPFSTDSLFDQNKKLYNIICRKKNKTNWNIIFVKLWKLKCFKFLKV